MVNKSVPTAINLRAGAYNALIYVDIAFQHPHVHGFHHVSLLATSPIDMLLLNSTSIHPINLQASFY